MSKISVMTGMILRKGFFLGLVVCAGCSRADAKDKKKVETTMTVMRCQAILDSGGQCPHQAESGKRYCWRHHGFVGSVNSTVDDAGKGASKAWKNTKDWSSNAWESTKSGFNRATEATAEAFDDARVGMIELFGGEDRKDKRKSAKSADAKTKKDK